MSIADALTRISQIQAQMTGLTQGAPSAASSASGGVAAAQPAGAGSFAAALSQAQSVPGTDPATAPGGTLTYGAQLPAGGYGGALASAADLSGTAAFSGPASLPGTPGPGGMTVAGAMAGAGGIAGLGALGGFGGVVAGGSGPAAALTPAATRLLTSAQQTFASRLAARTGLNPQVVSAWVLAEESGSAAQSRQSQGNNDWLNIGYTDSGTYGSADSLWSDPVSAADATAGWLKGQNTIPGYGTASGGIQGILSTAGQSPQAQVAAIQGSGWASSGYPDLPGLLTQLSG